MSINLRGLICGAARVQVRIVLVPRCTLALLQLINLVLYYGPRRSVQDRATVFYSKRQQKRYSIPFQTIVVLGNNYHLRLLYYPKHYFYAIIYYLK
jgi:hypothetical protein